MITQTTVANQPAQPASSPFRRLLGNRTLMLLWSGQVVSLVGDTFFNLAIMWVVYTQTGSALQTALIQVIWHLDRIVVGALAGVVADLWNRKHIVVTINLVSAAVVGGVATLMLAHGQAPPLVIFGAVFLLNSMNTFLGPAHAAMMPEIVDRDLLATASGWYVTIEQVAYLIASALAGIIIATVSVVSAVIVDTASFLLAALAFALARLPGRASSPASEAPESLLGMIRDGWKAIVDQPVMRALVWLSVLINVASFMGPLYPALVRHNLHGGAGEYGLLEVATVIGAMGGGVVAGLLERRLGAGRLWAISYGIAGICVLGTAASSWLPLTALLLAVRFFSSTVGSVSLGALAAVLTPDQYRGRVWGIKGALSVIAVPISTLIGGGLADMLGPAPLFAFGGIWLLGVAALAWANPHVRAACINAARESRVE